MHIDIEKVKQRLVDINESIKEIQNLTSLEADIFWSEKRNMAALKYYLLQAIEALGSICVHICAKKFNKGVSSLGECIEILEKEGVLDKDLSVRLRNMIRFRNKLVHRYWEIEDPKVYDYAREDIQDFVDFMNAIKKVLS